ncbi:MAG: polyketide synthase, partial [Candidatus Omnitrophica bacterium]|nr:polyketide synthase [Candidatus Omnitrophota bacterium]
MPAETHQFMPALRSKEPIAIIGIGCRFPGEAHDARSFWEILLKGTDTIRPVPADRWNAGAYYDPDPAKPGKINNTEGGFIKDAASFDAGFFSISPAEASRMDPQQRILLEVAYHTLEDAGIPLERFSGTPTGVYIGISTQDYASTLLASTDNRRQINSHSATALAHSIAANRLSFFFNLSGPSLAVDTACSSSHNALHLACHSLRRGESVMALAGGINLLLHPAYHMAFSRGGYLSPDARCRAFDSGANGYVRSEGAGLVLLKPLTSALRDKNRIYALITGTASNHDGKTPTLT